MRALPSLPFFADSPRPTWPEAKEQQDDIAGFLLAMPGGSAPVTLTIATGVITPVDDAARFILVDTEGAAAADDLDRIAVTDIPEGGLTVLRCADASRVVTVKNAATGSGEIFLAESIDVKLDATNKILVLRRAGGTHIEVGRFMLPVMDQVVAHATAYTVTIHDQGKTFTNEGATAIVVFTLPTAVAGQRYRWIVQDADGIRVTAGAADTIRRETSVTAGGGSVESTAIGSVLELVAINATEWHAIEHLGTWT